MLDPIESAISAAYTDWVEGYEVTHSSPDLVRGRFLGQEGIVYAFKIDPEGVEFQESRQDTADFNDYFLAQLHSAGANYHGDSAYIYWQGFVGADVRMDRGALKCKPGNTPCGGSCLPRGSKCRSQGGGLKQGGKMGKIGKGVAAGALVGAAIAGGVGLAKMKAQAGKFTGATQGPDTQATAQAKVNAKAKVAAANGSLPTRAERTAAALVKAKAKVGSKETAGDRISKWTDEEIKKKAEKAADGAGSKPGRERERDIEGAALTMINQRRQAQEERAVPKKTGVTQSGRRQSSSQDISEAAASAAVPRKKSRGRPKKRPIPQG